MKTKLLITSHVDYFENAGKYLLNSIYRNNDAIHPQDIIVVMGGGHGEPQRIVDAKEEVWVVPHNEFDFTALVAAIELDFNSDFFFLMHDTCYVGKRFQNAYKQFDASIMSKPVTSCQRSMSMGLYSKKLLTRFASEIMSLKNLDFSEEALQKAKSVAVEKEDFLFSKYPSNGYSLPPKDCGEKDFYGTGVTRKIEYYEGLDLYKAKSNWFSKNFWEIKL